MKIIQLLILALCIQTTSNGQSPYWTVIEPGGGWTFSLKMQSTNDGGCLGMGTKHTDREELYIIKFNSEGVQEWNLDTVPDITDGRQMATNMAELNGHYYVSVVRFESGNLFSSILKLTPDGELLANIENTECEILDVKASPDGNILVYYYEINTETPKLVKLTEQGDILWETPLEYKRTFRNAYGIINQAGNYVVANYKKSDESKAIVYEIGLTDGTILKESEFDFPYNYSSEGIEIDELQPDEYVMCNLDNGGLDEFHLLFLDETLSPINDIDIIATYGVDRIKALKVVEENIFIACNNAILVLDKEGYFENLVSLTIINDHTNTSYFSYSVLSIESNEQKDILLTGNVLGGVPGYVHYTKLNNDLNYEFTTNVEATAAINHKSSVFPNPATNHISILSDEPLAQYKYLDVIDAKGNIVLSKIEHTNEIDISQLPKGIYQIISISENGMEAIPFIKM